MENRIKMNSENLKKHLMSDYEDFFTNHNLVLSVNNYFELTPSFGICPNKIRINQKIPTKSYCGINFSQNGVKIGEIIEYQFKENAFTKKDGKEVISNFKLLIDFIEDFLIKNKYKNGINIDFLSENPRGHGFGFTNNISSLISLSLLIITGKINIQNGDYINNKENIDKINELSYKIINICTEGKSLGEGTLLATKNNNKPQFCVGIENEDKTDYQRIFGNLEDLLGININENIPIDFGIIYSGKNNTFDTIKFLVENYKDRFNIIRNQINTDISNYATNDLGELKNFLNSDFRKYTDNYISYLSYKTVLAFKDLILHGYDDIFITQFIETINENGLFGEVIEKENRLIKNFKRLFEENRTFHDEIIGTSRLNMGKIGGSFMFVSKYNKSRETLIKTIEQLNKIGYNDLFLEYASWIDGFESETIKVEQYINQNIYSTYTDENKIIYKDNLGNKYIGNYSEIIMKNNNGLLLDNINKKIYLEGKKLTSKEIHSQLSTIEILSNLIENIGIELPNSKFEKSSYSKNKNEMMGKIVLPIIKLINNNYGIKLPLICKGSLNQFYLKLNKTNYKIGIINKLGI